MAALPKRTWRIVFPVVKRITKVVAILLLAIGIVTTIVVVLSGDSDFEYSPPVL